MSEVDGPIPPGRRAPQPLSRRRAKEIASLGQKKYRDRLDALVVEGVRSVDAAVSAGAPLIEVVVAEDVVADPGVQALLTRAGVPVHTAAPADFARLSDVQASQGLLAVARRPWHPEAVLKRCRTILALDGLQDPGNAGTLIRTAAWFGVEAVLAGPGTVDLTNAKVVRAAMGGLWDLRLVASDDLARTLDALKGQGFACYGADLGGTSVRAWSPRAPSVLVLGSEAHGLSEAVRKRLDARVTIPGASQRGGAESLNVAVAAGIMLYAWQQESAG